MRKLLLLLLLLFFSSYILYAQSPWIREAGKSYLQLGYTGLYYDAAKVDGKLVDNFGEINDNTLQVYAEYGISNKLEAQLILPYKIASIKNNANNSENISGFGNISLGLKYALLDKKWKISSGVLYSANSIKIEKDKGLSTGFNASTILPYVTFGSSHNKFYYFAMFGYGYMTNNYSDYFKANIELGYNVIPNGHLIMVFDIRQVVSKESAYIDDNSQWLSHLDRQQYNAFGIKANYEFSKDKFGANISFFGAFNIDNAPLAPTISVGLYTKF